MSRRHPMMLSCAAGLTMLAAVLAGCSDNSAADAPSSSPTTGGASTAPATERSNDPVRVDDVADGPLDPGSYALTPIGPVQNSLAVVDLPGGYATWGPFIYASKPDEPEDPLEVGLWVVTGVFKDPCEATAQIPAGDSVRSLADALGRQAVTSVTKPHPVSLDGYDGLYLEIAAPTSFDLSPCNDAELNFWEAATGGERWTRMLGMVDHLWILDVDGQPTVLSLFVPPSATDAQVDGFTDIINEAHFAAI